MNYIIISNDMAKEIETIAKETFRGGLNCSQAVVSAYSEALGFEREMSLRISCGFGGGMGRMQSTCGTVTGAYMVLGLYNCKKISDNIERKAATYEMVRKFNEEFLKIHGTTDCIDLLKCEILTEEGHQKAKDQNLFSTVCEKCISDSTMIINKLTGIQD
jgi:C_GCAxxG_C_C family probable redox protein